MHSDACLKVPIMWPRAWRECVVCHSVAGGTAINDLLHTCHWPWGGYAPPWNWKYRRWRWSHSASVEAFKLRWNRSFRGQSFISRYWWWGIPVVQLSLENQQVTGKASALHHFQVSDSPVEKSKATQIVSSRICLWLGSWSLTSLGAERY